TQCHACAANANRNAPERTGQSSSVVASTDAPLARSTRAISALGSSACTTRPRATNPMVALPVPAPISSAASPRRSPPYSITVAKSASGYEGRAASYCSATSPNTSACSRRGSPVVIRSGGFVRGGELVHQVEDARGTSRHLDRWKQLLDDPARDLGECARRGQAGMREHDRP